ncbi:glycosyltransferase family 4 protein [uncultured Sphingomonas sp.]|uniref:glycosyltransferase family 4 protein n=1 Tax=uncultured Sphingomonas sp. TaxID=158754 RepID=UPI0035C97FBB
MTIVSRNRPLLMDARMLGTDGAAGVTGVATYARSLRAAQRSIDPTAGLLSSPPSTGPAAAYGRALRAALPLGARARPDAAGWAVADLFQTAHIHFTLHRRLLSVRVPGPAGLIHWSYPVPLRLAGWRNLYTVHDAIPLLHPELTQIGRDRHERVLRRILVTADRIVTVSAAARGDIVQALGCDPALVVDCSQPVDVAVGRARDAPFGLARDGYLLVCGTVEPRKNVARLLRAYRASGTGMPLVVAGPDGWRADASAALIAETPGVRRVASVDRDAMSALIAGARALLMPSLAEGFGLPVAEAMALGVPVLTSARGALAETAGAAALLVDPEDEGMIARGIAELATDDASCARLAARGAERARRFSPEAFARQLGALYATVFAQGPDRA